MIGLVVFAPFLCQQASAKPATEVPATAVSVSLRSDDYAITNDQQPSFKITFQNDWSDYVNLYNINAYWKWHIVFLRLDATKQSPGPWSVRFEVSNSAALDHKQLKPGESLEIRVDLNDPAYTFDYENLGPRDGLKTKRRKLPPGYYQISVNVRLDPPLGPGNHEWIGPALPRPVDLFVREAPTVTPSTEDLKKWDAAIDSVKPIFESQGGLWRNGVMPNLPLDKTATTEDVVASAVNWVQFGTKRTKILRSRDLGVPDKLSAALVMVGKQPKVLVYFFDADIGKWWTRFYDVKL
ncbi:MAG: hypothetical protein JST51_10300 [Armatimonadetes bacterium]|nr:hypothetical protein [Armatimonadota bacterium]